ncbi:hypothetical protein [Alistipes sp.]|uniref:hypothetical protein n=1 Tax=Alistipes sp. TaxID=1872444 RepID=UPI0023F3C435|nr:hypothetical protein [Alistipes sp.]
MKRLLSLLLLLSAMQSVAAVPAAANNVPAAGRADAILAGVSDGFRALGAYGVSFEVRSDEYVTRGRYAVEGRIITSCWAMPRFTATEPCATRWTTAAAR